MKCYTNFSALVLLWFLPACSHGVQQQEKPADTPIVAQDTDVRPPAAAEDCDQLVYRLVASTGTYHSITTAGDSLHLYTPADSLNFFIESADDKHISVKLSHDHEVEPGAFFDQADAFLDIDLEHEKLLDVTAQIDPPQETSFDTALFRRVKNCRLNR